MTWDWIIVGIAGLLGGMLNAVAGGGSFITLPALIFVGVPPVAANATGTAALLPGYFASAWRFRRDITLPASLDLRAITLIALAGGCAGAAILLMTGDQLFSVLIPWLILLATAAFVVGPWFVRKRQAAAQRPHGGPAPELRTSTSGLVLLAVCVYGGYFNGGLGIILLAALGLMGQTNLHGMNGLKNVISAVLTVVAVAVYAAGGAIATGHLLVLGLFAVLGGYAGAAVAYRVPQRLLRGFVVLVGCGMAIGFFLQ